MREYWTANRPATEAEIERLVHALDFALPPGYLDLLRRGNGGSGPLGLPPLWLELWSIEQAIDFSRLRLYARRYSGHFFFAANGAGEDLAMRHAPDGALEIVAVDTTLGLESVQVIARGFDAFVRAIGA